MLYLSKPLRFLSLPNPKSSFVHWSTPALFRTRQAIITVSPTTAVWSSGSRSNLWTKRGFPEELTAAPFTPSMSISTENNIVVTVNHLQKKKRKKRKTCVKREVNKWLTTKMAASRAVRYQSNFYRLLNKRFSFKVISIPESIDWVRSPARCRRPLSRSRLHHTAAMDLYMNK